MAEKTQNQVKFWQSVAQSSTDCINFLFLGLALTQKKWSSKLDHFSEPVGARTQDPILKRDVLYQLSY